MPRVKSPAASYCWPIQADYVGKKVNTSSSEQVDVLVAERDEQDKVLLRSKPA